MKEEAKGMHGAGQRASCMGSYVPTPNVGNAILMIWYI